jgi:thiamine-monophosphate kinase
MIHDASLSATGEFTLIESFMQRLGRPRPDTVVGAGLDDAAVLRLPDGRLQLATLDALVDGVHFERRRLVPRALGGRLAAVNLSDLAAMGGRPTHALAGLVAPGDLPAPYALGVVEGLAEALERWGAELVGGNVARGPALIVDLAMLGLVDEERLLLRSGGRPGDHVLVTGALGGAAAGRALLAREAGGAEWSVPEPTREAALTRMDAPEPRLEASWRLGPLGATAAIDVSDGLAADLGHLCAASGVGVRLFASQVPVDPAAVEVGAALGVDPLDLALGGGEDYELAFSAPAGLVDRIVETLADEAGLAATPVGVLTEARELRLVRPDGTISALDGGWRHFG